MKNVGSPNTISYILCRNFESALSETSRINMYILSTYMSNLSYENQYKIFFLYNLQYLKIHSFQHGTQASLVGTRSGSLVTYPGLVHEHVWVGMLP